MRLIKSLRKNKAELQAIALLKAPQFIYQIRRFRDIPVFCFHSVNYDLFEKQLAFLSQNGYKTLNGTQLLERLEDKQYKNDGTEIVLTFDDGMASVWTIGLPLLEKYQFNIILFILPGLVQNGDLGTNILNASSNEERIRALNRDNSSNSLCNWSEIIALHDSGLVDIQSHGMYHMRISISDTIESFIHPGFNANSYGNVDIPGFETSPSSSQLARNFVLGHPVYESASRLKGIRRYKDDSQLRTILATHILDNGGEEFFSKTNWRAELYEITASQPSSGSYESEKETTEAMLFELKESKRVIEEKLPGKSVEHFCFPWFQACEESARLSTETGYKAIHLGATPGFSTIANRHYPHLVSRLQEEYLLYLPGDGRISLLDVIRQKMRKKSSY